MREERAIPHRVVGLVMHILKEIRGKRLNPENLDSVSEELSSQGFSEAEINAAFTWVMERLEGIEPSDILFKGGTSNQSFRVLHPAERTVMESQAQGQLMEMQFLGLLSVEDVERIIERAMAIGGRLEGSDIQALVHSYLFDEGNRSGVNGLFGYTTKSDTVH